MEQKPSMRFRVNDMGHRRFYAQVTVQDKNTKEIKDLALDLVIPYRMDNKGCLRGHWYTLDEEAINGDFILLSVWQFDTVDSILLALDKTVNMSIPILSERKIVLTRNRRILEQSKQDIEDIVHGN